MGYEVQRLTIRQQSILDLHLLGQTNVAIAGVLGITPVTVSSVINSPLGQSEISARRGKIEKVIDESVATTTISASEILKNAGAQAATKVVELLSSFDEKIRLASAKEVLDRAGIGVQRDQAPVLHLSAEKIQLLVMTMNEAKAMRGETNQQEATAA